MSKFYNLLVKMHKIDYYFLHYPQAWQNFEAKKEYTIVDFFTYSLGCTMFYTVKFLLWIGNKISRIIKTPIAKSD